MGNDWGEDWQEGGDNSPNNLADTRGDDTVWLPFLGTTYLHLPHKLSSFVGEKSNSYIEYLGMQHEICQNLFNFTKSTKKLPTFQTHESFWQTWDLAVQIFWYQEYIGIRDVVTQRFHDLGEKFVSANLVSEMIENPFPSC